MSFVDSISPDFVGAARFRVSLSADTPSPAVNQAVIFLVDYAGADSDGGVVLPLRLLIQSPTVAGFKRRIFRRNLPSQVVYFPIVGGAHLITIGEIGHNQFFGALPFTVAGEELSIRTGR